MKRTATMLAAAAMGLTMLAGCAGGGAAGGGNAAGDTIKVGLNYELSGPVATYGQASVQGIEMAVDEINNGGGVKGKKIELVKYDNKSEPAEATTLASKLTSSDKVLTIIGPATSGAFKAEIPVATRAKVPAVSGSATADDVTVGAQGVQEYAFRTCFNDSFQGTAMAKWAAEKKNAKSALIIKDNSSDYSKGLADNFKKTFTAAGGQIVGEEAYVTNDTDFNAILTRAKGQKFDVIYLPGYYNEAGLIIKQARAQGITAPILGGDGFDSPTLLQLAGASALTDVYFTNHYSSLDKDAKVQKFISDFKAKYNTEPSAFNALGYDTAKFVADAANRASDVNAEGIKTAMADTKDFSGVTGSFSMDANHNPVKTIVVIGMKNGQQSTAEKVAS
ncbi:ABC transporter substrate-binding protein [Nigerium massiliense]|uniref:ABC transporter substrate-binding protein n=1 Tax=Nigerium massiliense TaxID=1522317 RepID=UPI00058BA2B2|nr:ABC transporter substrate-binding protein [Nigerium massiliense]